MLGIKITIGIITIINYTYIAYQYLYCVLYELYDAFCFLLFFNYSRKMRTTHIGTRYS